MRKSVKKGKAILFYVVRVVIYSITLPASASTGILRDSELIGYWLIFVFLVSLGSTLQNNQKSAFVFRGEFF